MPPWLPEPIFLIYLSGVFELVGAAAFVFRQRWAGWFCALVLVGVYPANIWFAVDSLGSGDTGLITIALVRLPLLATCRNSWKSFNSRRMVISG